jgi:hypothetical protein
MIGAKRKKIINGLEAHKSRRERVLTFIQVSPGDDGMASVTL